MGVARPLRPPGSILVNTDDGSLYATTGHPMRRHRNHPAAARFRGSSATASGRSLDSVVL